MNRNIIFAAYEELGRTKFTLEMTDEEARAIVCAFEGIKVLVDFFKENEGRAEWKCPKCHGLGIINIHYDVHGKQRSTKCPKCKIPNRAQHRPAGA